MLHKVVLSQVLTNCYGTAGGREAAASAGWAQPGRLPRSGQAQVPQVSIRRCADRCHRLPACSRSAGLVKYVTPCETLQVLTLPTMLTLARVAAIPIMFAGDDSPMPKHFAALQGSHGFVIRCGRSLVQWSSARAAGVQCNIRGRCRH